MNILYNVYVGSSPESVTLRSQQEETYSGQNLIHCCGLMRSPTMLTISIDGNRRNILASKRVGLGVIAISGFAENPFDLKAADRIVTSVDMLTANNIYKVSIVICLYMLLLVWLLYTVNIITNKVICMYMCA